MILLATYNLILKELNNKVLQQQHAQMRIKIYPRKLYNVGHLYVETNFPLVSLTLLYFFLEPPLVSWGHP